MLLIYVTSIFIDCSYVNKTNNIEILKIMYLHSKTITNGIIFVNH